MAAAMALSLACPMGSLADDNPKAQYGTPVIDGKIDAIWNTTDKISVIWAGDETATRYNAADKPLKDSYARVMWDENNLYFLVYAATDKTLLVVRDSYSDSLVPFLAQYYSEIHLLDLRYYRTPVAEYAAGNNIDEIFVCYSVENLIKDADAVFLGQ